VTKGKFMNKIFMLFILLFVLTSNCQAAKTCRIMWDLGQVTGHGHSISCKTAKYWKNNELFPGEVRYIQHRVFFFFWKRED